MGAIRAFLTNARTAWIVLLLAIVGGGVVIATAPSGEAGAPTAGLGDQVESARADAIAEGLQDEDETSGLIVFSGDNAFDADQLAEVEERAADLTELSTADRLPPLQVSPDGDVAFLIVPLEPIDNVDAQAERADELRAVAGEGLDGVRVYLTGAEGFEVDVAAVFEGADFTLLLVTVLLVTVLLLVTYRSPTLWLVPLAVIGFADGVAGAAARHVAAALDVTLDASITGILSVLVFGAGTNYALLLIARYRDELRVEEDRREAMRRALRGAGPAVLASGGTVVLALLTLSFASLGGTRALGIACAVGVLIAMAFALLVLPAALVSFGRWLFWPYIPRVGSADTAHRSPWARLGRGVMRRPAIVAVVGLVALGALATGALSLKTGLAQSDQFLERPDAVTGQEVLAEAFDIENGTPTVVVLPEADAEDAAAALEELEGVDQVQPAGAEGGTARLDVTLGDPAESDAAFATVQDIRAALDAVGDGSALVGGADAQALDVKAASASDRALLIPIILGVVLLVLLVLLRAVVAPLLLLATVVASFAAALGAAWYLFTGLFGFPALDEQVILLSFLFLVALGVDYNIFLVTRAQEESRTLGVREGMVRALASTGGVITSAGILLAAVFAVLGVLPLIALTQIGIIVCVGVLLDTLLVRTVIVPALAFLCGERFWWPRRPHLETGPESRSAGQATPDGAPVPVQGPGGRLSR
jgi:putative drug exporter of the RND superfamily